MTLSLIRMSGRYVCTPEHPWHRGIAPPVLHPGAHEVHDSQRDGYPGGDIVTMECPHCGHRWEMELPQ